LKLQICSKIKKARIISLQTFNHEICMMTTLPPIILPFLTPFFIIFSTSKTFSKMCVLFLGATLCKGGRTVCACLKALGMHGEKAFSNYHRTLNRYKWDGLEGSKIMLNLILPFTRGKVLLIVDEHLERRQGEKIKYKDIYRDPIASSKSWLVKCLGIKWVVLAVAIKFPWSQRYFALPIFCVAKKPATHPLCKKRKCRTGIDILCQMLCVLRRWHPNLSLTLVGDGEYAKVKLVQVCNRLSIGLVSRMRSDARLHEYPKKKQWRGRPVKLGDKIIVSVKRKRDWKKGVVRWYGGIKKTIRWEACNCLWYAGKPEVTIPIVAIWVKLGSDEIILMSTDSKMTPQEIIEAYIKRWNIEVSFRECREHLGLETQRQWSDKAIERSTPLLFCLYSLIILIGNAIYKEKGVMTHSTAWYQKTQLTFSDLLIGVKMEIWKWRNNSNSSSTSSSDKLSDNSWSKMEHILAECF
ncbi:MAG: transposase, partial [Vicingus serpentipes]|nr:transposase [Vicingus serpentipes]